ncbi:MAG TPA: asparagine synthase-related protein [Gemmatimonadaceae bacterium]
MSGIAAVAAREPRLDGEHFHRWTAALARVESEPRFVRVSGRVGLAASGAHDARGGISHFIDSDPVIGVVADARLDALAELGRAMQAAGGRGPSPDSDAGLIARAYALWGVACLDRLVGDFAFILSDERTGELLAARDHFGVRQLYYAATDGGLVVSSSARAVVRHPWVSRRLDDQAVVDFLVHDQVAHDATLFADVRRLRAGHLLLWTGRSVTTRPYWTLEPRVPFATRDVRDAPRILASLLRTAVGDRTRSQPAGVLLSGGVDSTAIMSAVCDTARGPGEVRAYTAYSRVRMIDREHDYAALAAGRLGVASELHDTDPYLPLQCPADAQLASLIPDSTTIASSTIDLLARVGRHSSVALTGIGPDGLLLPDPLRDSVRGAGAAGLVRTLLDAARHVGTYGRRPPMMLRRRRASRDVAAPPWLAREARDAWYRSVSPWPSHSGAVGHRQLAHRVMAGGWSYLLETYAAAGGVSGVSVAHPFLDLRVVDFCLRLPSAPWCWDKHVLRVAASGALPREVTRRRKTPLRFPWLTLAVREAGTQALVEMKPLEMTARYYAWPDFAVLRGPVMEDPYTNLRPVALDQFLRVWSVQRAVA